ncbi:subtilisin-like protease SBT1.2 [Miscanthus floridulus]|uniref:subtilisin-like protease SBT1.2 n=1 Tax=Miscanthus floridulus TaxID=154761 RepID=UPI003457B1BE
MNYVAAFSFVGLHCLHPVVLGAAAERCRVQLHPHDEGDSGEAMLFASKSKVDWHLSFLEWFVAWEQEKRLLYSYHIVFDGFAAQLVDGEAAALRVLPGVASGSTSAHRRVAWSGYGRGTIIGVLDTGVWPKNPSFDDRGMPSVPVRWAGMCQGGEHFNASNCNRKLIGAQFYSKGHRANYPTNPSEVALLLEYVSPRDAHGHDTHMPSTVVGAAVAGASVLDAGFREARGVAPGAHVATYKVCWFNGCYSSDIVAGMDDAVRDSVDVLSLSLGGFPIPLFEDNIAIGSFRATARDVSVVCAAGNNVPARSSVANEAPWVLTVCAGGEGNQAGVEGYARGCGA